MVFDLNDLTPVATKKVETRYRRITTSIPVPESIAPIQRLRAVEPKGAHGMPPIFWHQAEGFLIRDPYGNQWIDLTSGIVVANVGHAHPKIIKAVKEQIDSPLIFTYIFSSDVRTRLLERIAKLAPVELNKAVVFCSGSEANECAISLMRRHGLTISPDKIGILSMEESFHGHTLATAFTMGPPGLVDGINREAAFHTQLPRPDSTRSKGFLEDLETLKVNPDKIAGIILESITGWATKPYPQKYIESVMTWAREHQVLVTMDEVQAGMGRSGRLFAFEHYGIVPDLITCGKGLSSSLPVSAVKGRKELMDLPGGSMSSTFGGNPVCAAAALACLDVIEEEKLVERSMTLGEKLAVELEAIADRHRRYINWVDGRGLFRSIHLKDPVTGEQVPGLVNEMTMECIRRGVMLFHTGRFFKIVPPLIIEEDALFEAIGVISDVFDDYLK